MRADAPRDVSDHDRRRTTPSGSGGNEPVAIVGMACRFPGGRGLSGFRELLRSGGDAVEEGEPGSGAGRVGSLFEDARPRPDPRRFGAFVEGVDRFDAPFFGIPDREAQLMDPQHRLLLEVSWNALEHAGIAPGALAGSRTGVFAGAGDSGYPELFPAHEAASIYAAIGNSASTAIGRIAYALGLEGPALAVDTASSSSLVAVHQAVVALQRGDADLALAGGVNLILSPTRTETFANGGMLAGDGRCRSFAAAAQGYVRGEGCGVVVLEPLAAAEAAGHRILAVIRGSAVNQDGASAGLTAPRGPAQARLIEAALERAGWDPAAVDYLEGHGSGTPLGDPIEVAAALEVYGRGRSPDRPLLLGSVKTNIGHLEGAAGVAGLIKVVLALEAGVIPPQLHFDEPNPRIAWRELPVRVVTEPTAWPPRAGRPPRAGVSAFGLSGTNAHLLVEGYPSPEGAPRPEGAEAADGEAGGALVLPLSAKTPAALRRLAGRYRSWLDGRGPASLRDLAWTATVGRSHFDYRAGVVFRDEAELRSGLARVEAGEHGAPSAAPGPQPAPSPAEPSSARDDEPSPAEASATRQDAPALAGPSSAREDVPSLTEPSSARDDEPSLTEPSSARQDVPSPAGPSSAAGDAVALARAWESGAPVALTALFGDAGGRLVAAPGYPFEGPRYWVGDGVDGAAGGSEDADSLLVADEPVSARARRLESFLVREAQGLARLERPPAADAGFLELGLESLQVAELRNRLNRALGGAWRVSEAEFFSHPTPAQLAAHVAAHLAAQAEGRSRPQPARAATPPAKRTREPVAVVGMSCRFPGGGGVEDFWRRLADGEDLVTRGRPDGALPGLGGRESRLWGAYLPGLDRFDAEFFRIAPVEAELLDPQQRLLLSVSWEALEDAGIAPGSLKGSRTGVYAGMFASDYQSLAAATAPGLYRSTGSSFSAAIGRVAYTLGLEGPALAVDTACSASLVALHQAVAALERGEVDLALAGGVNAILTAALTDAFEAAGMLAPDGRCKTFDAAADGYVRGEGCGMLVLMRQSQALAGGHRIWGRILGSAVNQDGASAGLTAPNGLAQERLIAEALSRAGIEPASVDYLEAHGTGTPLGDPVELAAAAAAYGPGRAPDRPLRVGSVKTNIGHLEAAAGVAGVIKVLLAMREGRIPPHLHFRAPNPRLDWSRLPLSVVTEAAPWPDEEGRPRRAGVSSFGYSGTNAHVVLEAYPEPRETPPAAAEAPPPDRPRTPPAAAETLLPDRPPTSPAGEAAGAERAPLPGRHHPPPAAEAPGAERAWRLLPLSGRTAGAVRELAGRYRRRLDEAEAPASWLADAAWTAGTGRSHFEQRAAVLFRDAASLRTGLDRIAETGEGIGAGAGGSIAFLYAGQGSQWPGMGRELYDTEPAFRQALDRCEAAFREERDGSLLAVMFGASEGLDRTEWTQPALYALGSALTALWASVGVRPEVVFGHSVGELAAAAAAGAFGLEEGMRFAARRGALMGALPAGGAMAAVFAPAGQVAERLSGAVSLAADNATHQVVSGPEHEVAALLEAMESAGVRVEKLRTSHAFHSALMEPALAKLESAAAAASAPSIPMVSGVSGRLLEGVPDPAYWRRQAREPVAFARSLATLAELGVGIVVEIGPHPVLGPLAALGWPGAEAPEPVSSLRREGGGDFVSALAAAYRAGAPVSFAGLFAGERRRRVSLPTYPFQEQRYWTPAARRRVPEAAHPLLGARRDSRSGEVSFETELFADDPAWLGDHRVFGEAVAPAALYAALVIEALRLSGRSPAASLEQVRIPRPLVLSPEAGRTVQVVLSAEEGRWEIVSREIVSREVVSRAGEGTAWELHAEGRAGSAPVDGGPGDVRAPQDPPPPADPHELYDRFRSLGLAYGPAFRVLTEVRFGAGAAVGELALPAAAKSDGLWASPALLDGCFQLMTAVAERAAGEGTWLPVGWERLWLRGPLPERMVCTARLRSADGGACKGDLAFHTPGGESLGGVEGFTSRRASRPAPLGSRLDHLLWEPEWREARPAGPQRPEFPASPATVANGLPPAERYLEPEGWDLDRLRAFGAELEREARRYALGGLEALGWTPKPGERFAEDELRRRLNVTADHRPLFGRLLALLGEAGTLDRGPAGDWVVTAGSAAPPAGSPDASPDAPDSAQPVTKSRDQSRGASRMTTAASPGAPDAAQPVTESSDRSRDASRMTTAASPDTSDPAQQLLRRCAPSLAAVLRGSADPLELLFGEDQAAANFYRDWIPGRAANRMAADALRSAVSGLPEGRRLRLLEVGAGTGATTAALLPHLPAERTEYTFTDVSVGFLRSAPARFGGAGLDLRCRRLDIETDPVEQGFDAHGYDLVVAANVLHATRDLSETLAHCRRLLAPSGLLVAVEGTAAEGWLDLTFGLLPGWWRSEDEIRSGYALAGPEVWRRALADAGFDEAAFAGQELGQMVILARASTPVETEPGLFVLAGDGPFSSDLERELRARRQTVVAGPSDGDRAAWRSFFESLPGDPPLRGVAWLGGVRPDGSGLSAAALRGELEAAGSGALALTQGLADLGLRPQDGVWFVTRGGQVVGRETAGALAGSLLWGFGSVVGLEHGDLNPRLVDLDPDAPPAAALLADELLYPDRETRVAWRGGVRLAARLVRRRERAPLPAGSDWRLGPNPSGVLEPLRVEETPPAAPGPGQVRVAVEASGVNFRDVMVAMQLMEDAEPALGWELCGRVVEAGEGVSGLGVGDRVVGFAARAFGPEVVAAAGLLARAPAGFSPCELATVPMAFVTAALALEMAGRSRGERVLIHAGTGGVGQAAIRMAQAAGLEVYATASAPKQAYLRSLGVSGVFDSRSPGFGEAVLAATGGAGVSLVLNSLTGEGFIEAGLSCLAAGGSFVEIGRRGIRSTEEMAAARPDVNYRILAVDRLVQEEPERVAAVLRDVLAGLESGALKPLPFSRWPLAEAGAALAHMQAGRHVGKLVLAAPPLAGGRLRGDRSYLVTGGLGGIGLAVAGWLADSGAGAIVLNGRREPGAEASSAVAELRERGVDVRVEIADVTDEAAVAAMLSRIEAGLPPLAGVIHSVGVLSDGALANQDWGRFETVLWPKVLGAWRLHRATLGRELDFFVMFSSVAGVVGNPGQANYAAANAFLDQLARHRRALGLPGQAIAWGAWSGVGVAADQREWIAAKRARLGQGWITPQDGLAAFSRLLREDAGTTVAAAMDWRALGSPGPFLEDLVEKGGGESAPAADPGEGLNTLPAADREEALVRLLQDELAAVLGLRSAPARKAGFFELGMDSLAAEEYRNRLNRALPGGLSVSNTAVFDHPDTVRLAAHLAAQFDDAPRAAPARSRRTAPAREGERIAIVGMACRFPGAPDVPAFREQLFSGTAAVTRGRPDGLFVDAETEAARFPGAYVEGLDRFDAAFFRIAPIEAEFLDPQQRMLLEVSWAALEDAGVNPDGLRGSRTGVYGGVCGDDYKALVMAAETDGLRNLYRSTGVNPSTAVGRVAFVLGLMGPAVAVDTACSSSLVAVHQAAVALARGEVDLALAGGANEILMVATTRLFEDGGMLAPDGRCKTFDASADGYVRGEGCGMVVLKRLSDAEAAGDRILGVLLGSAVNQDGASAGLTVPNGVAQERVIEEALERAELAPAEMDYLEAHGTGTELGDPVEVAAAASVYGRGRDPGRPLLIGSVKTNIGHLEGAAGIAGMIKVLLALGAGVIPRHLHFVRPNPHLDWDRLPVRVTAEATPWPGTGRPRRAAVSGFGYSGTNAHVVLEGYREDREDREPPPEAGEAPAAERTWRLLPLSARTPDAVRELAGRYRDWLGDRDAAPRLLADAAWTAGVGRSHFDSRAAIPFSNAADLRAQLEAAAAREGGAAPEGGAGRIAFLYTGQGSQWAGMGRELYESEPAFREVLDRCDRVFRDERDTALLPVMFGAAQGLDRTEWTQPALYALGSALTALWASVGVRPQVVFGHSVGEIAAAAAAGVFDLEAGMRFAARRGALMGALPAGGAMAAVFAPARQVEAALSGSVSLAADNGAHQVVSGPEPEVAALQEALAAAGVRVEKLRTSHAFHSVLMEPALAALEASAGAVSAPALPLVTSVRGRLLEGPADGAYWRRQARQPVRFATAMRTLSELGVGVLVEIGPRSVLGPMAALAWRGSEPPKVIASQRREGGRDFVAAVAAAYEAGAPVSFAGLFAGERRRPVSLPTYPFQRQRHWVGGGRRRPGEQAAPLLGVRRELPRTGVSFQLDDCGFPWLRDHRVFGEVLGPAALYAAQAVAAAAREDGAGVRNGVVVLSAVQLEEPLLFAEPELERGSGEPGRQLQFLLHEKEDGASRPWEIFSRAPAGPWQRHAEGRLELAAAAALESLPRPQLDSLKAGLVPVPAPERYRELADSGLDFGPTFQGVRRLWCGAREAVAEVEPPAELEDSGAPIHPALLDACFQVLLGVEALGDRDPDELWLPIGWEELRLAASPPPRFTCHARLAGSDEERAAGSGVLRVELSLYAPDGEPVGAVTGLTLRRTARAALVRAGSSGRLLYEVEWRERAPGEALQADEGAAAGMWLVAAAGSGTAASVAEDLVRELERRSQTVVVAAGAEAGLDGALAVESCRRESWRSLFQGLSTALPLRGVVHLDGLDGSRAGASGDDLRRQLEASSRSALALTQGLLDSDRTPTGGIWFVTRGGQVVGGHAPGAVAGGDAHGALAGAALWGFARSLAQEMGGVGVRLLDLDPRAPASAELLAAELLRPDGEPQVAWRDGRRRVARLVRRRERVLPPAGSDWRVGRHPAGVLDPLPLETAPRAAPGAGEVRVAVEVAGVNFRDVVVAMQVVEDTEKGLGRELCGRVLEVGEGVSGFAAGDRVMGFTTGAYGPEVVTAAALLAPAPAGFSSCELATVPAAFVCAALALEAAGLNRGERILIHAGTGGVGQAAIQMAQAAGLEVYATASAPKQSYLRSLGVSGVFDSRSPAFGEQILAATGGVGVAMVLNSLTGEGFIEAGLSCLAAGGSFVEIGKRGIWSAAEMAAARPDVRYTVLAMDRLAPEEPERLGAALRDVLAGLESGALKPLPFSRWPLADAGAALAHMQAGRHMGKLVLAAPPLATGKLRADRSYLVTGGFGGLGMRVARWLLESGAGAVVLNGRRAPDPATTEEIVRLRAEGCVIREEVADVAEETAVAAMLARLAGEPGLPPLGGVIHCAGSLADATVDNQDWEGFERALGAKALGAWNLHRATEGMELDLFVLFSSLVGVLGNVGQTSHGAANAFLDQLALRRRALGLPGQSIAWGAWSVSGKAVEREELVRRGFEAAGVGWIAPEEGLDALSRLLREDAGAVVAARMDWAARQNVQPSPPLLEDLLARVGPASTDEDLLSRLRQARPAEAATLLREFVLEEVKELLLLPSRPSARTGFFDLGMDSLTAVEFRNRLRRALAGEVALSNTVVLDYPNAEELTKHLAEEVGLAPHEAQAPAPEQALPADADGLLAEVLSELGEDDG